MNFFRDLRFVAVLCVCLCAVIEARAGIIIDTPSGLTLGDQFRIAFVTLNTTQATSSDIAYYNSFVTNDAVSQAGGGGNQVVYGGTVLTWSAIGSTSSVSAITNIGAFGVPVYLASGTRVSSSDDASGLWSGSLLAPINGFLTYPSSFDTAVWTGTGLNGTSDGSFALGVTGEFGPMTGLSNKSNGDWIADGSLSSGNRMSMYGISQVLTVTGVPEIDPAGMGSVLALVGGALGLLERRRVKAG